MGVARRSRFVSLQRGKRRQTDWGFGPDMLQQSLGASAKLLGTTSLTVSEQQTIIRIRGILHISLLTSGTAGDSMLGAAGIALVNSDAFAVGATAIPGPQSDANWDAWMWHSFWNIQSMTATIADGTSAVSGSHRLEIDSRAMRKWDPAETLVFMLEWTRSGAPTARVNMDCRMLLKAA